MPARRLLAILAILVIGLVVDPARVRADAPGVYAITGATVHPVSGPAIPNATVLIRDGLIEAVGANVAIPADATTIDAKGMHVYPGFIDAHTSLGFPAATARRGGQGGGGGGGAARETSAEPTADALAIRTIRLSDDDADSKRATGVTTIVASPTTGIFNGQSAVLNLGRGAIESRVIKSPAALNVAFNTRPTWTYPDSLMGVVSYLRQTFMDAQQHTTARDIYERNPAGLRRPDESPALEAIAPALRREMPVVFVADSDAMIRRAQNIAREFNLRYIIAGARQGYGLAGELRDVPVLVSVKWPVAPTNKDDREEQPLRVIRDRQLAPTTPSVLAKAGVPFALVSGGAKTSELVPGIRKAIENGLSADDALRAVTLWPARIFGVDRQLGTLERGKIANVIVSDKPVFDEKAKVTRVFVDGRELRLPSEEKKDATAAAEASGSALDGSWNLSVRASEQTVAVNVTLSVADGKVTGTYSGDRGSGDIRNGTFDGTTVEFTITAQAPSAEASDWAFRGTVTGDSMSGTVTSNLGTFQFSGSKSK